ncbi:hypothetical protein OROMI_029023 [Orobanche minor]
MIGEWRRFSNTLIFWQKRRQEPLLSSSGEPTVKNSHFSAKRRPRMDSLEERVDAYWETITSDEELWKDFESQLEELWYEETGNTNFMWGHGSLKHSNFSLDEGIPNYGYTLYSIALPILQGTNGQPGLGDFLAKEGFKAGRYYDVADLLVSLKKFFGVEAYPTFFKHGGYHPSLFEIALLLSKDGTKRLDHPMAAKARKGKFLMRRI